MGKASRRKSIHRERALQDQAAQVLRRVSGSSEVTVRPTQSEEPKISEALGKLLDLEVADGAAQEEYEAAMNFIVMAWNMSGLSHQAQDATLQKVAGLSGDAGTRHEMATHLARLIARKQALFPHDRRVVVSWDMSFRRGKLYLSAAASAAV